MAGGHRKRTSHARPDRRWAFWILIFVLFSVNWAAVLMTHPAAQPRVTVPFSPYFLSQVQSGEVKSISSTGDTIQGTFATKLRYPPNDKSATPTTLFSTQVPSFWDSTELTDLLRSQAVEVNAESTSSSPSLVSELLVGFGPTLLLVGVFWLLARRAASGGGTGALGRFGQSEARRVDPEKIRVTFGDIAGIDDAKAELAEIVDFLEAPARLHPAGRADASWRVAVRPAGHGQDALGVCSGG